jgi:hypothetical protein
MKRVKFIITVAILLFSFGCSSALVSYIAVREERFRSEATQCDRIKLPLDEESRSRLFNFFKAGGDKDRIGTEIVDPSAEMHYAPLLDMLSSPHHLRTEDLMEKHVFKDWFSDTVVRQVIDAREESPPIIEPIAVTDGKYWWIFFHHHGKLTELLVVKAIPHQMER